MKRTIVSALLIGSLAGGVSQSVSAASVKSLWEKPAKHSSKKSVKALWKKPKKPTKKSSVKALWKPSKHRDTATQIRQSKNTLEETQSARKQMNLQLAKIAREIKRAELERIAIDKVLARLEKEQKKSQTRYRKAKRSIDEYGGKISKLDAAIQKRHDEFVRLLSDQFALIAAMNAVDQSSVDTVIQREIFEAYKHKNTRELSRLKREIADNDKNRRTLVARQKAIRKSIAAITAKQKLYQKKKREKEKLLASLAQKEKEYRKKLKELMARQDQLRQTLAKLNILRREEIARAKAEEEARRAELARKTEALKQMRRAEAKRVETARAQGREATYVPPTIQAPAATPSHVKQYGSSYQADNIKAYRGPRTISPLARARVVKRFGTYVDPIYKIKIFNDNVVLRSPVEGAKVRNVLNGKVVYVGSTSMLGKVVIVEHGRHLHTIYAALDRIAPLLKTGSRVKKGAVIGRVKRKLIFQATQDSKYINPLRLIRL
jgi:murein DD-endopeptidase MepM/ murein hydrolase activator NlpD